MAATSAPFPAKDPIADRKTLTITKEWITWFTDLLTSVDASPSRLQTVELSAQGASIGATAIPLGALGVGLYRVTYAARITRAATTSSSLTVTIQWTDHTVNLTQAGAPMTGNTPATYQTGTYLLRIDSSTPILYSTTYASVGATSMQYQLDIVLESIKA